VGHVEHLDAIRDKDDLHEVGHDEGRHVADIARDEAQQLVEGVFLDKLDDLLVGD